MRKILIFRSAIALFFLSSLLIYSCSREQGTEPVSFDADREALFQLVKDDSAVISIDGIEDAAPRPITYGDGFDTEGDSIYPIKIGRRITGRNVDFSVSHESDTIAVGTIIRTVKGSLIIIASTDPEHSDTVKYIKPFTQTFTRKIKFRRIRRTPFPRRNWIIDGVSLTEGVSIPTSLSFSELELISGRGEKLSFSDPLNTFLKRKDLPVFKVGDTVKVFVKVENTSGFGEGVMLHHGARHRFQKARGRLNDVGIYPDKAAGDGIYSGFWVVRRPSRRHIFHAFIDAMDHGTIFNSDAPFNSLVWGFPYVVRF